jgi:hypothetical protein
VELSGRALQSIPKRRSYGIQESPRQQVESTM